MNDERRLSRRNARLALLLLWGSVPFLTVNALLRIPLCAFIGLGLILPGLFLYLYTNRCPHCGKSFRGMSWSKPSAGYCPSCGRELEYDK